MILQDWISALLAGSAIHLSYVTLQPARVWDADVDSSQTTPKASASQRGPDEGESPGGSLWGTAAGTGACKAEPCSAGTGVADQWGDRPVGVGGTGPASPYGTAQKRRRISAPVSIGLEGDTSVHWGQCLRAACRGLGLVAGRDIAGSSSLDVVRAPAVPVPCTW